VTNKIFQGSGLLGAALAAGLALLLVFGGGFAFLRTSAGAAMFPAGGGEVSFHRLLQDYDFRLGQMLGAGQLVANYQFDSLSGDLDRMEARVGGVENWLSLLRRRRDLAARGDEAMGATAGLRYANIYRQSALRALGDFPFSEPIAAVAAAATIRGAAITAEREGELRGILPALTSTRFVPARLSLHVLLGDFQGPERIAETLLEDDALSLDFMISAIGHEAEEILVSLAILRILEGEVWEALSAIQSAVASGRASPEFVRFAAEVFYDFGNPIRSAELFNMLSGDDALSRQADALWVAGYADHARHVWALLAEPQAGLAAPTLAAPLDTVESRALFNLAVTAGQEEAEALFARLARQGPAGDRYRELGLIRFTRLQPAQAAVAILEAERGAASGYWEGIPINALIDLEILKRRTEMGDAARIVAETWMLLYRYPEAEDLFEWAAWSFALQRNFAESDMLLRAAERHGFSGPWTREHEILHKIREGRFDAAISAMEAIQIESAEASATWALSANLGRIFEARNAATRALEHYERALALLMQTDSPDRYETASILQFRVARCLRTIGRLDESRRALLAALELNPNNLSARLELNRM